MNIFFLNSLSATIKGGVIKRYLLFFLSLFIGFSAYSSTITSQATGDWATGATWSGGVAPTSSDNAVIANGHTVTVSGAASIISVTINTGGTLTVNDDIILTLATGTFTNNGTFTEHRNTLTFTGTSGTIAGSSATVVCNITMNLTNSTDILAMSSSAATIKYNSGGGILTLTKGIFKIGSANTLTMTGNGGSTTIHNPNTGGSMATTGTNGTDGGTVLLTTGGGNDHNFTGTAQIALYNLQIGAVVGTANRHVVQTNTNVLINGTLTLQDNNAQWTTNSPKYGSASTLIIDNNGQGYTPGAGSRLEWMAMASGTIGTTVGYPNNVTIKNMGTSVTNSCGFAPSGTWCIEGTLAVGDGTTACAATLESMTAFTCGGIKIDNGATLKHSGETFTVKGNWTQQGATTGIFTWVAGVVPITFAGSGTSGSPQTINCSGSTSTITTLNYVTISGGTYVKTNCILSVSTAAAWIISNSSLEADYNLTAGTFAASSGGAHIYLSTGNHTVTFAASAGVAWGANYLYIHDWLGGYDGTVAGGSDPKIKFGTGNNVAVDLTAAQLAKVTFIRASNAGRYTGTQTVAAVTGELVPTSTLPVELVSFSGEKQNEGVALTWVTASEINSDVYDILRSKDGKNFESIGKLPAANNSNKLLSYHFFDSSPKAGVNYYLLTEYDFDGKHQQNSQI